MLNGVGAAGAFAACDNVAFDVSADCACGLVGIKALITGSAINAKIRSVVPTISPMNKSKAPTPNTIAIVRSPIHDT
jgi:hypothetical protein